MLKKLAIGLAVLLTLLAGGAWYLFSNLDSFVKTAIQTYGTEATKSAVVVDDVKLSLGTGSGTIAGLVVANPQGFAQPNAISVRSITLALDPNSVSGNGPVVIKTVDIAQPQVTFEVGTNGSNLLTIKNNVTEYARNELARLGNQPPPRKLSISDLAVTHGQVTVTAPQLNKTFTIPLPDLHLHDVGGQSGASPAQLGSEVLSAITGDAIKAGTDAIASQLGANAAKLIPGNLSGAQIPPLKSLFGN